MLCNDSDEIKYYSEFWNEQGYVMKYVGLIKSSYWLLGSLSASRVIAILVP